MPAPRFEFRAVDHSLFARECQFAAKHRSELAFLGFANAKLDLHRWLPGRISKPAAIVLLLAQFHDDLGIERANAGDLIGR